MRTHVENPRLPHVKRWEQTCPQSSRKEGEVDPGFIIPCPVLSPSRVCCLPLSLFEGDPFQEAHQEHSGPRPSGLRSRKAPLVSSQGSLSDLLAQRRLQTRFFVRVGCGHRTARMASSNTVLRPRCVKAEHSRYFTESVGRKAVVATGGRQWGYPGFCSLC